MRSILRKLYHRQSLSEAEYTVLMAYVHDLQQNSPPSYQLFYQRFALILLRDYQTYLPRFACSSDDFFDYLLQTPELLKSLQTGPLPADSFPIYLHEYLASCFPDGMVDILLPGLDLLANLEQEGMSLPVPRDKEVVYKYESANPYKEIGLKSHFERIGRYSFVSRLQSVRYLRGHKASEDKIDLVESDCLGGVFTNKEKSIYYYIYLTEADKIKAWNACQILNQALYAK